ncbi:hypothetical protein SERLA73DRAFT_159769 [Serpula lacrymans var. lacrymans S7.3]|uniref:ABC transporter domain-containing protein n=1 Tax=Serpula lacrymans var. lacrymans (strain S7.3) TaxID=936435 RepID=F8PSR3_SERL3|nr:hypothetical protein SERLA73DRAFT_159769 [Serpula lacrymans var. lacrymans S7.3]
MQTVHVSTHLYSMINMFPVNGCVLSANCQGQVANHLSLIYMRKEQSSLPERTGLSASHVDVDYFDPQGVRELRRALSRPYSQQIISEASPSLESTHGPGDADSSDTVLNHPNDLERNLRYTLKKRDEADIKSRELGVLFEDLRVVGLGNSASFQQTLGSLLNPWNIIKSINDSRHPRLRDILKDFRGVVRPGEMLCWSQFCSTFSIRLTFIQFTVVLGRPGSGCSTFLKVLANQRKEFHAVHGNVHYNSFSPEDISHRYRGDVQYSPEDDIHFPTLTVEQTIGFAAKTRAPHSRIDGQNRQDYRNVTTDVLTTVFGLRHVKKSPVGNAAIRGVSGGEKKRVSISEALATRSLLNSWDNSTRGLDASTAVEFVRALRIATDVGRLSTIVSIYQAGESLYEMFDKVCVIYEGRMAYFGPADRARQYFIDMGYEPANRQTTSDFLVSVTDPHGRIVRTGMSVPRSSSEFEEYYRRSDIMNINEKDMASFRDQVFGKDHLVASYKASAKADQSRHTFDSSPYTISIPMQVRAVMTRRVQILKGSWTAQLINTMAFILQAIILGTTFLKLAPATSAFYSRGGILFFQSLITIYSSVFLPALFAMSEIPSLFAQRPIVRRHQKAAMYHPFIEGLAMTLVDIPVTFCTISIYCIILYFLVGLQRTAAQFFTLFLFVFVTAIIMKSLFRGLAASFKAEAPAQAIAGIMVLALSLYTGYLIPMPSMIGGLKWITYINPIRYSFEAILTNEFHTLNGLCTSIVPSGPGYENVQEDNRACTTIGSTPGNLYVDGNIFAALSFGYSYNNVWRSMTDVIAQNLGILIAFCIFFTTWLLVFTEFNTASAGQSSVTVFKRGSSSLPVQDATDSSSNDEEKDQATTATPVESHLESRVQSEKDAQEALAEQPRMTDIFSWQHINYDVSVSGESRRLLNDVSGYVAPGKLTALMGESGAGKTTLLNALAERIDTGTVTGDRFVNGHPLPRDFRAQTGYCQQTDTHLPTMTVRESLLFSAKMRQPLSVPMAEKEAYVNKCLAMCGLEAFAEATVGSLGVEHKKRTTIAVELAAKPQLLLFLDEPTSGLDSQSAWAIVSFLRDLADSGQAILCTIHQVFDRLLLLRKGGETVYFGDLGKNATSLLRYFEKNGSRSCEPLENPYGTPFFPTYMSPDTRLYRAEFMLDVIGAGATASSENDWHQTWTQSRESELLQEDIENIHADGQKHPPIKATFRSDFATPWAYQTWTLLKRAMLDHWRNPTYLMAKIMLNIVGGLLIGFTFFKRKDTIEGTQNKLFVR